MEQVSTPYGLYNEFLNEMENSDYSKDAISVSPEEHIENNETIVRIALGTGIQPSRKNLLEDQRAPSPDLKRPRSTRSSRNSSRGSRATHSTSKNLPHTTAARISNFSVAASSPDALSCRQSHYFESDDDTSDDEFDHKVPESSLAGPEANPVVPGLFPRMNINDSEQFAPLDLLPVNPAYTMKHPAY